MRNKYFWGQPHTFSTVLRLANSANVAQNPQFASGDVKISKDGGAFANLATLPTVTPAGGTNVRVEVKLSATEAQAKEVLIAFVDQTDPKEWDDQVLILSMMDARDGKISYQMKGGATMEERTGTTVESAQITRSGYPNYYLLTTGYTGHTKNDFNTASLCGAVIHNETTGSQVVILGGYFHGSDDKTYSPFGVAKQYGAFNIVEGGSNASALWTNHPTEVGTVGWTFICADTAGASFYSGHVLTLFVSPSVIAEQHISKCLDLRRMHIVNPDGSAISAICTGGNGNGMLITGMLEGAGLKIEGGANGGHGAHITGNNAGSTNGSGLVVESKGTYALLAHAIEATTESQQGHGILADSARGDGIRAISDMQVGLRAAGRFGAYIESTHYEGLTIHGTNDAVKISGGISGGNWDGIDVNGSGTGKDIDAKEIGAPGMKLTDTVDGTTVSNLLQKLMAMADGRFAKNTPAQGQVTFYKRDNATPLFVVEVTAAGRTREVG